MGRSKNIWHNYYTYCETSFVERGGTIACGVLPTLKRRGDTDIYNRKSELVSEHQGRSAFLLGQILMNYPDLTDPATWFSQLMFVLCHDVGEYRHGDLLDDGSLKANAEAISYREEELEILDEFFCNFPERYCMEMVEMLPQFEGYQGRAPLLDKMVEKLDAILFQLFLYTKGACGNVKWKKPHPSGRDLRFAELINSPRAIDVWTLHYRVATKHAPIEFRKPLSKILEVAFKEIYGVLPECMTIDVSDVVLDDPSDCIE